MIIPVRCFTCGKVGAPARPWNWPAPGRPQRRFKRRSNVADFRFCPLAAPPPMPPRLQVIGNKYETYFKLMESNDSRASDAMNELGLKRYCCRRMIFTHVDLIEKLLAYHTFQKKGERAPRACARPPARPRWAACLRGLRKRTSVAMPLDDRFALLLSPPIARW